MTKEPDLQVYSVESSLQSKVSKQLIPIYLFIILLCRVAWCTSSTKYLSVGENFA